ncbi:cob(I)alamin adenosyltransferase [Robiginitalea myxolifaciens]|uniref:Corrinoid adenosyltransferase n=1 Tax=Robiginitalea myxolifaciens TaxID=400055 RepID=A0A1I6H7B1_9FLAO|nr:cob(I)yrinic acid a,c-diamide adenosyltransferase [Robiginitalea myxolifaciens]SFR50227.1 cob(I)alamin adenosyltransferase [Robiginitalea myxolifaciens]
MKIYTKTGDAGTTALFGGTRVPKHHIRIQSYGTVDELNSWIGLLYDQIESDLLRKELERIQDRLFTLGSQLATEPAKADKLSARRANPLPEVTPSDILALEEAMDRMDASLEPMTHFILPGGHPIVSQCHVARTVCRRAERMSTLLNEQEPIPEAVLKYLNRLSDYLFILARKLTADLGVVERKWMPDANQE